MAPPRKNRRGKRHQGWQEEEQPEVDDLAVAASFAQITTLPSKPIEANGGDSSSSPVNDDASSTSSCSSGSDKQEENDKQESDNDDDVQRDVNSDDDSDDESDVDLTEALARMKDDDEDVPKKNESSQAAPTTEHELDPYRTPISDLETKFQLNLTVAEQERLRLDKETAVAANSGPVELCAVSRTVYLYFCGMAFFLFFNIVLLSLSRLVVSSVTWWRIAPLSWKVLRPAVLLIHWTKVVCW
jgi:hypothetical protein